VDNLVTYNAAITDPDDGRIHTNYKVVNIIGIVAAADMQNSLATPNPNGPPIIDVDFDRLVIDDAKAGGYLMFRLAESTNGIIVHEHVRNVLLDAGFQDLAFHDTRTIAL
jgi:hypothetical protein